MQDEIERKAQQVQKALEGLDVQYSTHSGRDLVPDMASVNGYSIIWHEFAYCAGEPDTVEVMIPNSHGDSIRPHVLISELRELVES